MRILALSLCVSMPLTAWSGSPHACDTNLTHEQWRAVRNETSGGDPVLDEAIAVEKARYAEDSSNKPQPVAVDWAEAKKIVLLGAVRQTFEHLDRTVTLLTWSGRLYTSREPRQGDLGRLTTVVDPCGVYILRTLE